MQFLYGLRENARAVLGVGFVAAQQVGDVLMQRAAQGDVDALHAAASAQHGHAMRGAACSRSNS